MKDSGGSFKPLVLLMLLLIIVLNIYFHISFRPYDALFVFYIFSLSYQAKII